MPSHWADPVYVDEDGVEWVDISWIGLYSIKHGDTNTEYCDTTFCTICTNYTTRPMIPASEYKFDQYGLTDGYRVHYQGE